MVIKISYWIELFIDTIFFKQIEKLVDSKKFLVPIKYLIDFYQVFENDWIFINHGLSFQGKYPLQVYCFQF